MPNKKLGNPLEHSKGNTGRIRLRQKVSLVLFGILLVFCLLEVGLRLGGFIILSFREQRNLISARETGAYRILCLGESTTAGQYPSVLEAILNQKNLGMKFSVIDQGVPATSSPFILRHLQENIDRYDPQMVIVMMGINDSSPHMPEETVSRFAFINFLKSMKTYKLSRLLSLHLEVKIREIRHKTVFPDLTPASNGRPNDAAVASIPPGQAKARAALYIKQGLSYLDEGNNLDGAEALFKEAQKADPHDENSYLALGRIAINKFDVRSAEALFKKAIQLNPGNSSGYSWLGFLYLALNNDTANGEKLLKQALAINPDDTFACLNMGHLCYYRNDFKNSEYYFKKAISLEPQDQHMVMTLVTLYVKEGRLADAEGLLREQLEQNPQNEVFSAALISLSGIPQLNNAPGKDNLYSAYRQKDHRYNSVTAGNYLRMKNILDSRGIKLVCVQYPCRSLEPLKAIFAETGGVVFVDNEKLFNEALKKGKYSDYFKDMFGGDFGHCTVKGNRLLSENIADTIIGGYFNKHN